MQRIRMDLKKLIKTFPRRAVADLTVANLVAFSEMAPLTQDLQQSPGHRRNVSQVLLPPRMD